MAINYSQQLRGPMGLQQAANVTRDSAYKAEAQGRLRELAPLAAKGDADAIAELYAYSPNIAAGLDQRNQERLQSMGQQQAQQVKGATTQFMVAYKQADPETRLQMQEEAIANPLIDVDAADFAQLEQAGNDIPLDFALINLMGADNYKALMGGQSPTPLTNIKTGEDGNLYGLNPKTGQYEQVRTPTGVKFKSGGQNITIGGQKSEEKVVGEYRGESFVETQKAAREARSQMASLNQLESLNEKAFSGTGAGIKLGLAKIGKIFGIETEGLTESELFNSIASNLTLEKASQMAGALSDKDIAFLKETVPTLSQTKEGRARLIKIMKAVNDRMIEYGKLAAKYRRENEGSFDLDLFSEQIMADGKDYLADFYPEATESSSGDLSQLSDEELERIAFGGGNG